MKRRTALTLLAGAPLAASLVLAGSASAAETHLVKIQGFNFSPKKLTVKVGDTIVFEQRDGAPHTATARDGSWDTDTLSTGQAIEIPVFEGMGTKYFCRFHPSMTGTLVIES